MRSRVLAVLVVALGAAGTLSIAACGGDSTGGDVAPRSTPDLTVPNGADALARDASGSTTSTSTTDTSTGTTTAAPEAGVPTDTGAAAPAEPQPQQSAPSSTTGGAVPDSQGGGTGGTGGAGGAGTTGSGGGGTGGAGDFNQFCQDNPGACPGN
jgi:hypothetical protein